MCQCVLRGGGVRWCEVVCGGEEWCVGMSDGVGRMAFGGMPSGVGVAWDC